MAHNQRSRRVFRYRFDALWVSALMLPLCVAVFAAPGVGSRPRGNFGAGVQSEHTKTGVDVLEEEKFAALRGKRVGLITNQTGVDSAGHRTIDVLAHAEGVKLVAIFSPEHGIAGKVEDATIANETDAATGLPVFSLYGETRRPTAEMLANLDALVFDIQDAGVRFYTYVTTMGYAMEEAAKHHIAFFVLDRPNPLGGEVIEGPVLDRDLLSFTGYFPMPVRYAMTLGELAQMFNAENKIGAELHVVAMKNWRRAELYNATGLTWIPPSPNLRSVNAALLYPGIEILQAGGISVGRGTDTPFEVFGAPWIHGAELAETLNARSIAGVKFEPTQFTPRNGLYAGQPCEGLSITVTYPAALRSMRMGMEIAEALHHAYPTEFHAGKILELVGSQSTVDELLRGDAAPHIVTEWFSDVSAFRAVREKYLIYH
jgi:uncharacterized protein YbbC (DUF1343 family)